MSTKTNIRTAIRQAKEAFSPVKKDAKNTHYGQRYPTLDSVLSAIEPALDQNNVEILPSARYEAGRTVLVTELHHVPSGESEICELALPNVDDPQKIGSAITYFRRYSICLQLNLIAEDDDDGNKAAGKTPPAKTAQANAKPTPAPKPKADPKPADPNDPDLGKPAYNKLLDRLKTLCETFPQNDVLDRLVALSGLELRVHHVDTQAPRPYVLKSLCMKDGVVFDKESPYGAHGLTQSKVDAINFLLDDIERSLGGEGLVEGEVE